ncbi:MAG: carbohydrate ABC transporter permease [Lachnospiraceae bacterium]|nr:carbohydrate ABC transporter permease [Lachnospiraceae bacterium]
MNKAVKKTKPIQICIYIAFTVLLFFFLVPFLLVLLNSFKSNKEIILDPLSLPEKINFSGYVKAFGAMNYLQTFKNSLIITVLSIVLIVLFAVMCAYFFARNNWKINRLIFMIMVMSMIIPFQTIMIPIVKNFSAINAVNNIFMVVVFYVGAHISMAVFMFQGFIKSIPAELDEAATIDGCNKFQVLFYIIFPLLKPIISTVAILDVLAIWNDFLLPYILLQSNNLKTLPLMTYSFFGQYSVDYSLVCSGLIMSILPVIIIYAVLQKQIIDGVVSGAIK